MLSTTNFLLLGLLLCPYVNKVNGKLNDESSFSEIIYKYLPEMLLHQLLTVFQNSATNISSHLTRTITQNHANIQEIQY